MADFKSMALVISGLIVSAGAAGGIDTASDVDLAYLAIIAMVGFSLMLAGISRIKNG